jgi:hypothetical protein
MLKRLFLLTTLTAHLLSAEEPYFGGTLLSDIPVNIPPGGWYFEPYLYVTRQTGTYTPDWNHSSKPRFTSLRNEWEFETGITNWLDIAFYPTFFYTHSSFLLGDTKIALGFQVLRQQENTVDLRFILQESFPSGKYNHLKSLSQATGSGTYQTWISAVLYKILLPFTLNFTFDYIFFSSNVTVRGLNAYNILSHATFRPGQQFFGNLGIECSLTTRTILGLDIHYQHQNSSSKTPSSEQFSLAPCIEYNPTPNLSFEAGSWFTLAGRNAPIFTSAVLTVYWQF